MDRNEEFIKIVEALEKKGTAVAFILFPLMFVAAQIMHPDIFHSKMIKSGGDWINHFRGQDILHLAHFLEFLCSFLLVIMGLHYKEKLRIKSPVLSSIGVYMAITGSIMLLSSKSALCLTISGFDTLSDSQLQQIIPALDALLEKRNYLAVLWLLPLLPLGYALIGFVLFRTGYVPRWQSSLVIIGSLLLANPEIEAVNFFASFFLAGGLILYGVNLFNNTKEVKNGK